MGLGCTRFASVSGIVDRGNHSCARDLARLAHAVLGQPAPGADRRHPRCGAAVPDPRRKALPLQQQPAAARRGYPGADGVKTGYTVAAGRCLVASARRGPSLAGGWCCCTPPIRRARRPRCSTRAFVLRAV